LEPLLQVCWLHTSSFVISNWSPSSKYADY
jgi:hypothetical protein